MNNEIMGRYRCFGHRIGILFNEFEHVFIIYLKQGVLLLLISTPKRCI